MGAEKKGETWKGRGPRDKESAREGIAISSGEVRGVPKLQRREWKKQKTRKRGPANLSPSVEVYGTGTVRLDSVQRGAAGAMYAFFQLFSKRGCSGEEVTNPGDGGSARTVDAGTKIPARKRRGRGHHSDAQQTRSLTVSSARTKIPEGRAPWMRKRRRKLGIPRQGKERGDKEGEVHMGTV